MRADSKRTSTRNCSKDEGDKKDFRAIEQLIAASREENDAVRWKKLGEILDRDRFASFLAVEALLGMGDGYDFGKNNYRIYHDPSRSCSPSFRTGWMSRWQT
jgi:spore coat protein CotH